MTGYGRSHLKGNGRDDELRRKVFDRKDGTRVAFEERMKAERERKPQPIAETVRTEASKRKDALVVLDRIYEQARLHVVERIQSATDAETDISQKIKVAQDRISAIEGGQNARAVAIGGGYVAAVTTVDGQRDADLRALNTSIDGQIAPLRNRLNDLKNIHTDARQVNRLAIEKESPVMELPGTPSRVYKSEVDDGVALRLELYVSSKVPDGSTAVEAGLATMIEGKRHMRLSVVMRAIRADMAVAEKKIAGLETSRAKGTKTILERARAQNQESYLRERTGTLGKIVEEKELRRQEAVEIAELKAKIEALIRQRDTLVLTAVRPAESGLPVLERAKLQTIREFDASTREGEKFDCSERFIDLIAKAGISLGQTQSIPARLS